MQAMLAIVGIALFLGFVFLGSWQLQRLSWKLQLIERVDQRVHSAPEPLPSEAQWPDVSAASHEYLPVQAQGHWLLGKSVLSKAVTELGAGYWLMSPLQLNDGAQVLVNRGFIPDSLRGQWQERIDQAHDTNEPSVKVQGLLRITEPDGGFLRKNLPESQQWFSRDVVAIARQQSLTHAAPFFIDQGLPVQSMTAGSTDKDWPRSGMTVIRFHNSHLVYAVTWYTLAAMVVGAAWLVRRHHRQSATGAG